ncbi:hypothetical protein CTI12_AA489750 [Artemisia annua]|uniref:Uncharacterized protein n=1 Tax=Artemisia annua TaxID=35608 RepID=A0A2U1LHS6_ARTAN|nr:hypothetical protein CTI12_AA489750 [Artemisia annua]
MDGDFVNAEWNTAGLRRSGRKECKGEADVGKEAKGASGSNIVNETKCVKRERDAVAKRKKVDTKEPSQK